MGGRKEGALMSELQNSINRVGGFPGTLGPGQGGRKKKVQDGSLGVGTVGTGTMPAPSFPNSNTEPENKSHLRGLEGGQEEHNKVEGREGERRAECRGWPSATEPRRKG